LFEYFEFVAKMRHLPTVAARGLSARRIRQFVQGYSAKQGLTEHISVTTTWKF
jgi:hypothetical protein